MNAAPGQHRLDHVDGLRAIAVLAVILFHFQLGVMPQGFLGVDIFFVISGYVVFRSMSAMMLAPRISLFRFLERFYRRRFWRIIPALFVMVAVVLVAAMLFIPSVYLSHLLFLTAAGAATATANMVLMLAGNQNYFDQMLGYNPLMHTWSLGVEEQFYLVFPLVAWAAAKDGTKHWRRVLIPGLTLLSFLLAAWMSAADPEKSFYLLPTRFWELGAGALCHQASLRPLKWPPALRLGLEWLGITVLLLALVQPAQMASPFPGALLPVAGMCLILMTSAHAPANPVSLQRWLSARLLVYLGRISYSLYLWHWPVLVLQRWTLGTGDFSRTLLAATLTAVLAVASYHAVESPLQASRLARKPIPAGLFLALFSLMLLASLTVIHAVGGQPLHGAHALGRLSVVSRDYGWRPDDLPGIGTPAAVAAAPSAPSLIVVGDSHAGAIRGIMAVAAQRLGMNLVIHSRCSRNLLAPQEKKSECDRQSAILAAAKPGDIVVLASLNVPRYVDENGSALPSINFADVAHASLRMRALSESQDMVRQLLARGVGVVIRNPEPVFHFIPFRCSDWFNRVNPICSAPRTESRLALQQRAQPAFESLRALKAANPRLVVWDVFDVLCPGDECPIIDAGGHPLFSDQDHLTGWGGALLLPSLMDALRTARSPS